MATAFASSIPSTGRPKGRWWCCATALARCSEDQVDPQLRVTPRAHPLTLYGQGEPDDIAWGVVYLASDESKFVTGSELVIDGGYGKLKGKTFRISNMGDETDETIGAMLKSLDAALAEARASGRRSPTR